MMQNGDSVTKAPKGGLSNKIVLFILLFMMLAFNLYQQSSSVRMHMRSLSSSDDGPASAMPMTTKRTDRFEDEDEADSIVRRSYEASYARMLPCDDDDEGDGMVVPTVKKNCLQKTLDHFNEPDRDGNSTSLPPIPWWFQTLLRDAQSGGAYGFWHHFYTTEPPLNFCTMEKSGTTEWRKVFCRLNAQDCVDDPEYCGKRKCAWRTKREMPDDAPWAVFLRDPLERLLSGFLDKCYKPRVRAKEKHCEPNAVFNPDPDMKDSKYKRGAPSLIDHLEDKNKQFFAAYLDVMPLKWNVHFVPQAIACDLHRNIHKYDFVGNMGEDFMFDLERMANRYGDQLPDVLNTTFRYKEKVALGKKNTGKEKNRHATHAPEKVAKFYTARSVRRGLEMLSIDYATLGLEVPEWARRMLRDDNPEFRR